MGWVLFKLGKYEEALGYLQKAVSKPTGGDSTIWDHLGDCQEKLGQKDKAVESWRRALDDARKESMPEPKLLERLTEKLKNHVPPAEASQPK
jgi:Tfp pilus assembly protein PilF